VTLGGGSAKQKQQRVLVSDKPYTGWSLPLISPELSDVIEKELRYSTRNAQLRMMTLMPLILIVVLFINRRRFAPQSGAGGASGFEADFFNYGAGLMATTGILYVFLILAGLFCNQFAFDQ